MMEPDAVIKWIAVVFAAGFVGYFGRYLSMQLIDKVHNNEKPKTTVVVKSSELLTPKLWNKLLASMTEVTIGRASISTSVDSGSPCPIFCKHNRLISNAEL